MKHRLTLTCLCFAWICANGAFWDAVQVVAWGRMFVSNARVAPLSEALRETFDAEKPCAICRAVSKAKEADQKNETAPEQNSAKGKMVLALVEPVAPITAPALSKWPAPASTSATARTEPVPLRPPRV